MFFLPYIELLWDGALELQGDEANFEVNFINYMYNASNHRPYFFFSKKKTFITKYTDKGLLI